MPILQEPQKPVNPPEVSKVPATMPMPFYRNLPVIEVRHNDLPELAKWEIHSQHYLVVKVNVLGKMAVPLDTGVAGQSKLEGTLQITAIKALGEQEDLVKKLEQEDWEQTVASHLNGKA